MAKEVGKKFSWEIKNFSSLQCKKCYSVPVLIGDCKWRLRAYPKGAGDNVGHFSLYLEVADFESLPSGWRRYANYRLTIVNHFSSTRSVMKESHCWFDQNNPSWGFGRILLLSKLCDEKEGFLVNGEVMIVVEVDVLEVVGTLDDSEKPKEASSPLKNRKLNDDDGMKSNDTLKEASSVKEREDVKGFQVLPSQVESVRRIFERHPYIAVKFRAKNQYLRNACMSFLLSIIETLCQSLEELSGEDLVEAEIALTYLMQGLKSFGWSRSWSKLKKRRRKRCLVWLCFKKQRKFY